MELSDKEFQRCLVASGIPRTYTDPSIGLSTIGAKGDALLTWLKEEGYHALRRGAITAEIVSDDPGATDAFYLMARACIKHAIPTAVFHARELLSGDLLREGIYDDIKGDRCLFIDGVVSARDADFNTPQKAVIEWFLSRQMMDGLSLVFLHERAIESSDYSPRFKKRISAHRKFKIAF
jgi:hypothetical protein